MCVLYLLVGKLNGVAKLDFLIYNQCHISDRPEKKWNRFAGYSLLKKLGSIRNKTGLVSFYRAKQKYDAKGYFSTTWRSQVAFKSNDI